MKIDKNRILKLVGAAAFAITALMLIFSGIDNNKADIIYVNYAEFLIAAENGEIKEVILSENPKISFSRKDSDGKFETDNPRSATVKEELLKMGVPVMEGSYVSSGYILQTILSMCLFAAGLFAVYKVSNKGRTSLGAMSLNVGDKSKENAEQVGFGDIAGNEEAKDSVCDIVDFIKNPEKYSAYGARMPRGVIFYGSPGTGKTLLARAIAGEAGVPFYATSGSDFVQMYVGVGAGRVRDLFKKARESGKAVIFIDEIDALGKKRSNAAIGGNDERDQTLNALLTEMSGFSGGEGIVVIAATNRIDTLDEALLRPGRFDRQVEIGLPDFAGRLSIIKLHAKNKPLSEDVDLNTIAKQTVYFSGAMLENLLNEAAISAAKRGLGEISVEDIDSAYYTVVAGSEKKDKSGIREKDRRVTAYHESGHAVAAKLLSPENSVTKVTIIPSTKGAGGFCLNIPPDKMYYTKKELEMQAIVSFAGRAAEELVFGADGITTGASNDLEKAAQIVTDYITKYGMSDNGLKFVTGSGIVSGSGTEAKDVSKNIFYEEYASKMEGLYKQAINILSDNFDKLNRLAETLLEKDTLNESEIDSILV